MDPHLALLLCLHPCLLLLQPQGCRRYPGLLCRSWTRTSRESSKLASSETLKLLGRKRREEGCHCKWTCGVFPPFRQTLYPECPQSPSSICLRKIFSNYSYSRGASSTTRTLGPTRATLATWLPRTATYCRGLYAHTDLDYINRNALGQAYVSVRTPATARQLRGALG